MRRIVETSVFFSSNSSKILDNPGNIMKHREIIESVITPIGEFIGVMAIFFFAYFLRGITDGIPFIQLRIPFIRIDQFLPFVFSGVVFWIGVFATGGLYRENTSFSFFEEVRAVIIRSGLWFLLYIGFVYMSIGVLFEKEIPRLIIIYVWILATIFSIMFRMILKKILHILYKKNILIPKTILLITSAETDENKIGEKHHLTVQIVKPEETETIKNLIREKKIDTVLLLERNIDEDMQKELIKLCSIYGISFAYPKILPEVYAISKHDTFIGDLLVVESHAVSISLWERIIKRIGDFIISSLGLIVLSPLLLIIALSIKIEDPSGPIIYRNRRIGFSGKEFFLYKFRYMYWKYSVKDSYGIDETQDSALQYEEELKKKHDTRSGPLYKIKNDPRKTRVGKLIEKLSLDELPQLYNVLIGNMSLIGPRPHQPREVEQYKEEHYQVLTIKPGITGMAQVYGRDKNSFEDEVTYDRYYIEHYSPLLDIMILIKTIYVVIKRVFE